MTNVSFRDRLVSAHAVFCCPRGSISRLARDRRVPRQTVYRQARTLARAADPACVEQTLVQLREQLAELRRQIGQLQAERDHLRQQLGQQARVADDATQAQFAATAQALGVSLSAARALLAVLLGPATLSVSHLGRLSQQAAQQASATLAVLDEFSRGRARQVAADEIFVGKDLVLMTIEQDSLCWLGGRRANSRDGQQWHKELQQFPAAEQVTRDGGQGLRKGVALVNAQRRQAGRSEMADQEDHFHIMQRARRALKQVRLKAERAFRRAEKEQAALRRDRRRGKVQAGRHSVVARRWKQAEQAMDRWSAHEQALERLRDGLRPFTPQGELKTPEQAEAEVRVALAKLTGPEWSRVRTKLVGREAFTYLVEAQRRLAALPLAPELRQAAVRQEVLRRQPQALRGEGPGAGALRGVLLAASLVLTLSGQAGAQALALVRGVLDGLWRSSSLVEELNGVLRMHQRRQKRMTQSLLDLKRLYWNIHVFAAGRRKGTSPYERLGVVLPSEDWWHLLKRPPEQLRQELSALNTAA
jgi:hypothetical protein